MQSHPNEFLAIRQNRPFGGVAAANFTTRSQFALGSGTPVQARAAKLPRAVQVNLPTRHPKHGDSIKSPRGMYDALRTSGIL
jgi:hypothetical protein